MEEETNSGAGCIALIGWFAIRTGTYFYIMDKWIDVKYIDGHYVFNTLAAVIMFNIGTYMAFTVFVFWSFEKLCNLYFVLKARGLKK